jgi:imidazolonepropionase-like amidohydrolase
MAKAIQALLAVGLLASSAPAPRQQVPSASRMASAAGAIAARSTQSAQPTSVAIKAGRILNVGTGAYAAQQIIWIEGDRIRQIGSESELSRRLPAGTRVIDLSDATVLPGLIDAHTHLTVSPESLAAAAAAARADLATGQAHPVQPVRQPTELSKRNALITIQAGFTTVRNLGGPADESDFALRDAIDAGRIPGPRMLVSGTPLTGGVKGVPELSAAVEDHARKGADVIKFFATGGVVLGNDVNTETYSDAEMRAIVDRAHALGRKVAAHAHGAAGIKDAVLAGVDSIEHGSAISEEIIQLMKARGTYLVPTVYIGLWFQENATRLGLPEGNRTQAIPGRQENLARAFREGVKVAFGSDSGTFPHGLNAREFGALRVLGLTPLQAIQASTVSAADLLGWSDRVGTLEAGKFADIISVEGDPLSDLGVLDHVRLVMKGGTVVKDR